MKHFYKLLLITLLICFAGKSQAIIRYVKPASTGLGDGSSWGNASANIQAMVDSSAVGDQVWIAGGTFLLTATLQMKEGVNVYGSFAGFENSINARSKSGAEAWEFAYPTILDGHNVTEILRQPNNFSMETIWDGVVITNSNHRGAYILRNGKLINCIISRNNMPHCGDYNNTSDVIYNWGGTISHCLISENCGGPFGAIYNSSGTISHCLISENFSVYGGGICNNGGTINHCIVSRNTAIGGHAGGIHNDGGTINHCIVSENIALLYMGLDGGFGGGIYITSGTIKDCTVSGNVARYGGGIYYGRFGFSTNDTTFLTNVLVVKNYAQIHGGGIRIQNLELDGLCFYTMPIFITNLTVSGNMSGEGGGIYTLCPNTIRNSIIWGNTDTNGITDNVYSEFSSIAYQNCLVGGEPIGNGIILNDNPFFIDTANSNYRLHCFSPAIDAGNNACLGSVTTDLDGNPRIINGTVDLGVYEFYALAFSPLSFIYNGMEQAPVATTSNNIYTVTNILYKEKNASDITYSLTPPIHAGNYTIRASLPAIGICEAVTDTADFVILPKDITVKANGGNSVYGDNPANRGFQAATLVNGETESVLTGISNNFPIDNTTPAGTYTLSVTGTLTNRNYNITAFDTGTWTVYKRPLTIKATDETIFYGDTPALAYEIVSGNLVNGDTLSGFLHVDNCNTGIHTIEQGTLTAGNNYIITFMQGILTVIDTNDVSIKEIIVDGKPAQWKGNHYFYEAECGRNEAVVKVISKQSANITVTINGMEQNPSTVNLLNYGSNNVTITLTAISGKTQTYTLIIYKLIPFEQVASTCGNTTINLINNPTDNGGLRFISCIWYRNGQKISTEQSWSAKELLNPNDEFYAELTTEGYSEILRTCKGKITLRDMLKVYPNPTAEELKIENMDCQMETDFTVCSVTGQIILQGKLQDTISTINVEYLAKGVYYLRIADKTVKFVKL